MVDAGGRKTSGRQGARQPGALRAGGPGAALDNAPPLADDPYDPARLEGAEQALGLRFRRRELLAEALVHRSYVNEHPEAGLQSNERLEFLGDAVLGAVAAHLLFDRRPDASEGELTLLRTALVRQSTLAGWARELGLGQFVLVGLGETRAGVRERDPLLARTFEAAIGALYLDQGFEAVRAYLEPFIARELAAEDVTARALDAKSRLQQLAQSVYGATPTYRVLQVTGPQHSPHFTVEVQYGPELAMLGEGRTKQEAQQDAAQRALEWLEAAVGSGEVLPRESRRSAKRRERTVGSASEAAAEGAASTTPAAEGHPMPPPGQHGDGVPNATGVALECPDPAEPAEQPAGAGSRPRRGGTARAVRAQPAPESHDLAPDGGAVERLAGPEPERPEPPARTRARAARRRATDGAEEESRARGLPRARSRRGTTEDQGAPASA